MARRNIAKTAIEGGRRKFCRIMEKEEDAKERTAYKIYCHTAVYDEDAEEPGSVALGGHYTGRQYRDFPDKLGPLRRWLEAQVGRPWNNVRSEIIARFDSSTLAGRHALGHMEGFVILPNTPYTFLRRRSQYEYFPGDLYVDKKGFLRQAPKTDKQREKWSRG